VFESVWLAIRNFPRHTVEAFSSVDRVKLLVGQSALCYVSALPFAGWLGSFGVAGLNFLLYEFVLEPLLPTWFGPYWEREPRD
jgi:hypothetical protein